MELSLDELDGKYLVHSERDIEGEFVPNGDGETEIRNGLTYRKDSNGYIWESSFTIIGPTQVQMESTIDTSHAPDAKFIKDEKGNPTRGMMTYRSILNLSIENGKTVLKGVIEHAGETTRLTLTKI